MKLPFNTLKTVHFVGIGGIGMSGIAEILHSLGYRVQGSDLNKNANTSRLEKMGINIFIGHEGSHVHKADVIVISSAVKNSNIEIQTAKALSIPVIKRSDMLAEIMRFKFSIAVAGTHGKTTTTSMNATLLDAADMDPTIINGGIINSYNTNAKVGHGEWIVVEADESDGSFIKLPATIGIITNIDAEHMEYYGDFETLKKAFIQFIDNLPFYGLGILCIDHPVVLELSQTIKNKRILTYGFSSEADIRAYNVRSTIEGSYFDVDIRYKQEQSKIEPKENITFIPKRYKDLFLPMPGNYNVQNFLSCIAVAEELKLKEEDIRASLLKFKGVKRRFTKVGTTKGITIIDDYAHHPKEIETVINAAKSCTNKNIIVVIQPHRYSRLNDHMEDFVSSVKQADCVIISPVYTAGEEPIEGASSAILAEKIRKGGQSVYEFNETKELPYIVSRVAQDGDFVLCLGAGSITTWAAMLPLQLEQISPYEALPSLNSAVK